MLVTLTAGLLVGSLALLVREHHVSKLLVRRLLDLNLAVIPHERLVDELDDLGQAGLPIRHLLEHLGGTAGVEGIIQLLDTLAPSTPPSLGQIGDLTRKLLIQSSRDSAL